MPQGGHPPHHSITSSARARPVCGTSRPSAFAVFRLMMSSYLVSCPYRKLKQLTGARESVDSPIDERSLQIDLVRLDRAVPAAGRVRSRNRCPSTSAQRAAAQIPEASGAQQHRPAVACFALSDGARGAGRPEDHKAGDVAALAPCRLPSLLALEIPTARRPAKYTGGHSLPHSRDECRQPALGRSADPWRTTQARHRCRTRLRSQSTWQGDGDRRRRAGRPFFAMLQTASHRWILSWYRRTHFGRWNAF